MDSPRNVRGIEVPTLPLRPETPRGRGIHMQSTTNTTIAVDLAKSVFEVAVSHRPGAITKRHRLSPSRFARFLAQQAPATIVMEACGTAHYWAREAQVRISEHREHLDR